MFGHSGHTNGTAEYLMTNFIETISRRTVNYSTHDSICSSHIKSARLSFLRRVRDTVLMGLCFGDLLLNAQASPDESKGDSLQNWIFLLKQICPVISVRIILGAFQKSTSDSNFMWRFRSDTKVYKSSINPFRDSGQFIMSSGYRVH